MRLILARLLIGLCAVTGFTGCDQDKGDPPPVSQPSGVVSAAKTQPDSLAVMRQAAGQGRWEDAWRLSKPVLIEHSDDADVVSEVAKVAFHSGNRPTAADLLESACEVESYANGSRVRQAMTAKIDVGQLFDGMRLLQVSLQDHPGETETRRWLFDFLVGTEQHAKARVHGHSLIRSRQFDVELLLDLGRSYKRKYTLGPLEEMVARYPKDKRPLLGKAKGLFDSSKHQEAIELLQDIVQTHPEFLAAQALLARAYVQSGDFVALKEWASQQDKAIRTQFQYWMALGESARAAGQHEQAARSYWEATKLDSVSLEAFSGLNAAIAQLDASQNVPTEVRRDLSERLTRISNLSDAFKRFVLDGQTSSSEAAEIASRFEELGRLWEAEAWSAIATTLAKDNDDSATRVRVSILQKLTKETPWQIRQPALAFDLNHLPIPEFGALNEAQPIARLEVNSKKSKLAFVDESRQRGLRFFGRSAKDPAQSHTMIHLSTGCGGGTIDFDLDGWSDLYLMSAAGAPMRQNSRNNALMRNASGQFTDVTEQSGSSDFGFGQGVAVGDVNEDGFPDLLVLNFGSNAILINQGDGSFANQTSRWLSDGEPCWSTSGAIADLDGDGLADAITLQYCRGEDVIKRVCSNNDIGVQGCGPLMFTAGRDQFYAGAAEGRFVDATGEWSAVPRVPGRGLGVVVGEFNDSPGVDVYVANDISENHFYHRSADSDAFRLQESALQRGLALDERSLQQGSMGIAATDLTGNGEADFFVTNFESEHNVLYAQSESTGFWRDVSGAMGLRETTFPLVGFGTEAIDFDLDGNRELVVTNGHLFDYEAGRKGLRDQKGLKADSNETTSASTSTTDSELSRIGTDTDVPYAMPMQVFRYGEGRRFVEVGKEIAGSYFSQPHVGRALWTIDANRDGLLDFAVTHQTEPVALLMNQTKTENNVFVLELRGRDSSRDAVGAKVTVSCGDQSWKGFLTAGDGYLCSNERRLQFGLGESKGPVEVAITWPDGTRTSHHDLAANREWLVVQGESPFDLNGAEFSKYHAP